MKIEIIKIPGFMDVNSAILELDGKRYAFDPWGAAADWPNIDAVFVTHGHFDHVVGLAGTNIPWYMDPADNELFEEQRAYLASFGKEIKTSPQSLLEYADDLSSIFRCHPGTDRAGASSIIHLIKTPGHTPGGVCYYFPNCKDACPLAGREENLGGKAALDFQGGGIGGKNINGVLLTGDTLFTDTVGRTDFPGGDHAELMKSLAVLKSLNFPPDTLVVPGHGQTALWSQVLKINPYMK